MDPLAFFREKAVRNLIDRASEAASTPVSIHFRDLDEEGVRILGTGQCEACRYVSSINGGRAACRASRDQASSEALRTRHPVTFLCHMGFACVVAPALPEADMAFTLTFGPYCPAEAPELLEQDALAGLRSLRLGHDEFPVKLTDIAVLRAPAVPTVAQWTMEALASAWSDRRDTPAPGPSPETNVPPAPRRRARPRQALVDQALPGSTIAAALASGNQPLATRTMRSVLAESIAGTKAGVGVVRGRTLALAGSIIESLETAKQPCLGVWDAYPAFAEAVREAQTGSECLRALLTLFGPILRIQRAAKAGDDLLGILNQLIADRLPDDLTLEEVAERLNRHPTAITHQLQRKYGMSYSQYIGRLRLEQAKELLRRTRLSVGDVGRRVGIDDQSNFSKLFRKFEGQSPQAYRQQFRKKS
ncbi:MAG: hypothetical protein AMXMBFR84_40690 [Candidatus Hydrogenedentota bacterium]